MLRTSLHVVFAAICAGMLLCAIGTTTAAAADAPSTQAITDRDVDAAIAKVKTDPNLSQEKTIRSLKWRSDDDDQPKRKSSWFSWIGDLFAFIAQTGRVIVWLALGVAIALLIVVIVRIIRSIEPAAKSVPFTAPTHVRDLDIRPESLPDDIGAAARTLWEQGEHRAALALLYRGLLSRLVHVHALPIRHSSTEGDCLALAVQRLPSRRDYVSQVIRVWQHAVYGGQLPQNDAVYALCSGFAAALNTATASAAP